MKIQKKLQENKYKKHSLNNYVFFVKKCKVIHFILLSNCHNNVYMLYLYYKIENSIERGYCMNKKFVSSVALLDVSVAFIFTIMLIVLA